MLNMDRGPFALSKMSFCTTPTPPKFRAVRLGRLHGRVGVDKRDLTVWDLGYLGSSKAGKLVILREATIR